MPVLGIDVGGTNLRGAVADEGGTILSWREAPTPTTSAQSLFDKMLAIARELGSDAGVPIAAAGIGFPGLIDWRKGIVRYSPHLPHHQNIPLAARLGAALRMKVFLGNDANLAALGERWLGAGRDIEDFVLITLGTGVGSGLIIEGRPFWGATGYAAELGHVSVEPNGQACACGAKGCLEAYCSAVGLRLRALAERQNGEESMMWTIIRDDDNELNPLLVESAALRGDGLATRLLADAGRYLGIAIAALADLLGISTAIVGGRMAKMKFDILKIAQDEANRRAITARAKQIVVTRSLLGDKAGCLGAIRYAMDSLNA